MAELPWRSRSRPEPERDCLALLSYLPLNSGWHIPRLLLHAARVHRQLRTSPGLIGYSLLARLATKRFWTLSAWEDEAALQEFVAAAPHADVIKELTAYMGATRFTRWTVNGSELPLRWDDALKRGGFAGSSGR
jgi:heme-degrading monooxygenase HmoA